MSDHDPFLYGQVADSIADIVGVQEDGTWNVAPFRWPGRINTQLARLSSDNAASEQKTLSQPPACGHTVEIGICSLEAGHDRGHHDQSKGTQWFDRVLDYGPGAYASIQPGDSAWRHDRANCPIAALPNRSHDDCLRCIAAERDELRQQLKEVTEKP